MGREERREYVKKWQQEHRASHNESALRWGRANKAKHAEASKRWTTNNHERFLSVKAEWRNENRDRYKVYKQTRRALRYHAGTFTKQEWKSLCDFYGNKCLCCGEAKTLTVDHVLPLSRGGTNTIDNIQPLCLDCNKKKHQSCTDYRLSYRGTKDGSWKASQLSMWNLLHTEDGD